jgi:hypothetical protein
MISRSASTKSESAWRSNIEERALMIPETLIRCFVNPAALDPTVEFYKSLFGGEQSLRRRHG